MSGVSAPRPGAAVDRRRWRDRAVAYARLAKLDVFDYHLAIPLAWTLLEPAARGTAQILATLALYTIGSVCVTATAVALDDVTGYRDGSDAANYAPDAPARRLARKPLLTGALTIAEAMRFALLAALAGALAWLLAVLVAPGRPAWAMLAMVACLLMAAQYSYGLKLSYRGGQELILIGYGVCLVLGACGLLGAYGGGAGSAALVCVEAVLFGCGPLLFGVYSNTNDIGGDAAVRRRTVAVVASSRGNAAFIIGLSVAEAAVVFAALATGVAPWWFLPALLPMLVLRVRQLRAGLWRHDILRARRLGIHAHRATAAGLAVANLCLSGGLLNIVGIR